MQIDWLTVAAQIANFLVLVWLLNRFLYGPVTRAMQAREEGIEARLDEARQTREAAEAEADRLREKHREFDTRREDMLNEVRGEVEALREELEHDLQEKSKAHQHAWKQEVAAGRDDFVRELSQRAGQHIQQTTRAVLNEFTGADLGPQLADRFVEKLENLDDEALKRLRRLAETRSTEALIESSVPLHGPTRGNVTRALHNLISKEIEVTYREREDMVFGVRLTIAEQLVEWSAAVWLDRLDDAFIDTLEAMTGPAVEGEA
ncbi:F0F1 ATP synthase subunit B family protein [Marimonas arenosa]|uniref:ATP synthase subunit b n=1 Tax=Marimonas arenosa TaxID=1795305 RepID=A0AAE4B361_9RHOB|nr:hypothetical protein [Marimonas arenosa]MDQ2088940.1 hypothetical protein [Marimonas arenosa]